MKISRIAMAGAFVMLAGCPHPCPTPGQLPTGANEHQEWQQMCAVCADPNQALDCYSYDDSDGGVGGGGSCTYPPCSGGTGMGAPAPGGAAMSSDNSKKKLMCATCRAMCPDTVGRPRSP